MHLIIVVVYDYKWVLLLTVAATVSNPVHSDSQKSNVSDIYKQLVPFNFVLLSLIIN